MANAVPFSENGGFAATMYYLMVPTINGNGVPVVSIWDTASFDDPDDPASYTWRAEDITVGRVPTVRRIVFVVNDMGVATVTVTISGTNDNFALVTASKVITIGTTGASGNQLTYFVDLALTCFRPQLSISRAAGGGPISIVSASMIGEIEEVTL